MLLGIPCLALADWRPEGVPLCSVGNCGAGGAIVVPDGLGGAFFLWGESRNGNSDIYAQRLTASGNIPPGWPVDGLPVCTEPTSQHLSQWSAVPDGLGGMLVAWEDFRNSFPNGTSGPDIYAQRILPDGTIAPGWPVDGAPVARRPGHQSWPVALPDGTGGGYFSWEDIITPRDIYVQRLTAAGVPAPAWPADGVPACTDPEVQASPQLATDGIGGVYVAWSDARDGTVSTYAQRVRPDGTISPGWPADGAPIVVGRAMRELIPVGTDGAYVACTVQGPIVDDEYYLQRFTGEGTISPGWPAGGVLVCAAANQRAGLRMSADGEGGALLTWYDSRGTSDEIYAMRMRPDGTRAPGWPEDGLRVTDIQAGDYSPVPAADGLGGVYLAWDRNTGGVDEIVLHHLSGAGAVVPGWPLNGLKVPGNEFSHLVDIAEDGTGGAIAAWAREDQTVRALRIGVNGPVAVALSLVSVEVEVGFVRLLWYVAEGASLRFTVERRSENGEWERLAEITPDGTEKLAYEDRAVVPGTRYGYRLSYTEEGSEGHGGETWVSVPRLELALRGFQPNPSAGIPMVGLVLAEAAPATLEVYDVAGRKVASREVGALGPGRHELRLDASQRLAPGVYAIRLVQGERALTARGVVTR